MKAYIYARVSSTSDRQNTDRQISDLRAYAQRESIEIVEVYSEHISGATKNTDRPVLMECLDAAKTDAVDIILFSELSRLGRSILEVQESVKYMVDNRINAYFQKENLRLMEGGKFNPMTSVLVACLSMCAEMERENIKFRLNSGRELAKSQGVKMGRKEGYKKPKEKKEAEYGEILKRLKKGDKMTDIAAWAKGKGIKCSLPTIQRLKKEFC